jgi:ribosomal protein S14
MKYLLYKDKKYRKLFIYYELKKILYKILYKNLNLRKKYRLKAYLYLLRFSNLSSRVKIKNRCIYTYRANAVYRDFKVSRIMLKNLIGQGNIIGLQKSSF